MNRLCTDYVLGQNPCGSSCCVSVFPYFFFMIMNFIEYIMYELYADYETGILDYVFHI